MIPDSMLEGNKNKILQFSAQIFPEVRELTDHFNDHLRPIPEFHLWDFIEKNSFVKKLYQDCFKVPDKEFYQHHEQNFGDPNSGPGIEIKKLRESVAEQLMEFFRRRIGNAELGDWKPKASYFKSGSLWPYYRSQKEIFQKKWGLSVSGTFYYPPGGFREWHTNNDHKGWRMYYIRVAEENKSWTHYLNPGTGELIAVPDRDDSFNVFYVADIPEVKAGIRPDYLWHNVVSHTHRRSLGFYLNDELVLRIFTRSGIGGGNGC